ncbi:MAG: BrnA antitoxin family protein [Deltaproteobacteria bacterium]|nr:MAG: BrnA antitoxin family protein [Deltaproteobacteria bacterium]
MSVKSIRTKSPKVRSRTDWKRLRQAKDTATDNAFWAAAEILMPQAKTHLSVRFDKDIVDWFKRQGPGYQTRMNAVLRAYMQSQLGKE